MYRTVDIIRPREGGSRASPRSTREKDKHGAKGPMMDGDILQKLSRSPYWILGLDQRIEETLRAGDQRERQVGK